MDKIKIENIPITKLRKNTGQIDGLPKNPRLIKDDRYLKLIRSVQEYPEMLNLRELLVYPLDDIYVVICGNARLTAGLELKFKEMPCKILPVETTIKQLKAYAIKDNISFGDFDFELLNVEWDMTELDDFGLDISDFNFDSSEDDETENDDEMENEETISDNKSEDKKNILVPILFEVSKKEIESLKKLQKEKQERRWKEFFFSYIPELRS